MTIITQWAFPKLLAAEFLDRTGLSGTYNCDLEGGYVFSSLPVNAHAQCGYVTAAALNRGAVASCNERDHLASFAIQM